MIGEQKFKDVPDEVFFELTGYSFAQFEVLTKSLREAQFSSPLDGGYRMNAAGAGNKYKLTFMERLFMILVWIKHHIHPNDLSELWDIHPTTFLRARKNIVNLLLVKRKILEHDIPRRKAYCGLDSNPRVTRYLTEIVERKGN